jgi:hypothetical protein
MEIAELKTLWKLAKSFWILGFIFWLLETIVFLIIEGWHIKATHPIEIHCDKIVLNIWEFALNLTIVTCVYFLININKKR